MGVELGHAGHGITADGIAGTVVQDYGGTLAAVRWAVHSSRKRSTARELGRGHLWRNLKKRRDGELLLQAKEFCSAAQRVRDGVFVIQSCGSIRYVCPLI